MSQNRLTLQFLFILFLLYRDESSDPELDSCLVSQDEYSSVRIFADEAHVWQSALFSKTKAGVQTIWPTLPSQTNLYSAGLRLGKLHASTRSQSGQKPYLK